MRVITLWRKTEQGKGVMRLGRRCPVLNKSIRENLIEHLNKDLTEVREQGFPSKRCLFVE